MVDRNDAGPRLQDRGNVGREVDSCIKSSTSGGSGQPSSPAGKHARNGSGGEGANVTPPTLVALEASKIVFRKWLELPDDLVLDFVFGVVFANRLEGDPVWGGIVGPSGDAKTEILRSLDHPEAVTLSNLTPRTLISGLPKSMNRGIEPSLLARLDGKDLIVKDLTPLISGPRDARSEILGQLRDAYDGSSAMAFGTGEKKEFHSRFGLLFGVTPVIESCWSVINQLGERFNYYRCIEADSLPKVRAAVTNSDSKAAMRQELAAAARRVLDQRTPRHIEVPDELTTRIIHLADLVAKARTPVKREGRTEEVTYLPAAEVGTRLGGQLVQLARGVAAARGQTACDESVMDIVCHVARSGIPHVRLKLLAYLQLQRGLVSTAEASQALQLGAGTVRRYAEDLWTLGLVTRAGTEFSGYRWGLSDLTRERLEKAHLSLVPPDKCTLTQDPCQDQVTANGND